jgi:phosphopantetheinyl transferase
VGARAALAVARDREVGIDLEPIDPGLDVSPLLAVACSQTEAARIAALAPLARPEAFLTCWTLKEA